jgi:acyl dehydratase
LYSFVSFGSLMWRHTLSILNRAVGEELSPLVKPPITQEQLRRYAQASGDSNPIHLDEEAAHRVGLDGVIAHGMLSMAFLGQFVTSQIASFPEAYLARLKVRFMSMVRVGDTLACHGIVKAHGQDDAGQLCIDVECWAQNQRGEKVTVGEAVVAVGRQARRRGEA